MKHRKKQKPTRNKQEEQHKRNLFFKKIQQFMALIGDGSAFTLLNKTELAILYHTRIRPYKIVFADTTQSKHKVKILDSLNSTLNDMLHKTFVELGKQKIRISLYDFSVYVETIYFLWRNANLNKPEITARFKACFTLFDDSFKELRTDVVMLVEKKLEIISWLYSDLTCQIIRFVRQGHVESTSVFDNSVYFNNYLLEEKEVETEPIKIDGNNRTIYRVCRNTGEGFAPLTITPERLGMNGLLQKFPLKVFIQMHTLERFETRLGRFFAVFHYPYILIAVLDAKPIPTDEKNSFLFPVTCEKVRLGYLKADVIGDKLIIRTFLFLTNNGTPEGKKLNQLVGLQKADKKYLGIDKLSTFIQSDIKKEEKLKALFCEAGCGELFNLDKSLIIESVDRELATAQYIAHYLGI